MPRRFGYAPVGQRCYGRWDWHAKGRANVISALWGLRLIAVIVLDNAAFHKRQDIQNTLHQAGHTLEYLPPYSPDLNPIEHKWAQAKAIRKQTHCSVDELFRSNQI